MAENNEIKTGAGCKVLHAGPCGVVIFGASGQLAHKKLFPSYFKLLKTNSLGPEFFLAGAGRKKMSGEEFRVLARKAIMESGINPGQAELDAFTSRLYYYQMDYADQSCFAALKENLEKLSEKYGTSGNTVFMFSVPPDAYLQITKGLGSNGLTEEKNGFKRIMVEKPFGSDTETAALLNESMLSCMDESQIYRVDHFLGKNTIQNIMVFRFANIVFQPVWNSRFIDSVQVIFSEDEGIEGRAGYFEQAGLIRDMLQNHLLQLLTLVAMEKPAGLSSGDIQKGKLETLKSIRPFDIEKLHESMIRGQYAAGKNAAAYRQEQGVDKNSCVETFFAAKIFFDNETWRGVPFYVKAGKRLDKRGTSIHVLFKDDRDCLFCREGIMHDKNMLTFDIQPDQGLRLKFNAKVPGQKMCLNMLNMDFNYEKIFGPDAGGDYENIILDCMLGDRTLFWGREAIEESWKLLTPVLRRWEACSIDEKSRMMFFYEAGSRGPKEADEFIARDKRAWVE